MPTKPTTKKTAGAASAKKPAAKEPAAPKKKPAVPKPKPANYTDDDVALRAYFISEKRQRLGLPGNSHADWIEAIRQLDEESRPKKK